MSGSQRGRVHVYGEAERPGAPGTWDRPVWWALNRSARVGAGTGRNRWRLVPPFRENGLLVTAGRPRKPFGWSTAGRRDPLTHVPHTILFAWRDGRLAGRMVAWQCPSRTAYFQLADEPVGRSCQLCVFVLRGRRADCPAGSAVPGAPVRGGDLGGDPAAERD